MRDAGSGMGKNQDPGSGINIPDPPHWGGGGVGGGLRDNVKNKSIIFHFEVQQVLVPAN
jgi:hypothetical protein